MLSRSHRRVELLKKAVNVPPLTLPANLGMSGPMLATMPFRALVHRNFRLYLFGQGVSVLGTWMQQVAVAWLVYCLTGSAVWLGIVAFAGQIPCLFVSPFAGALIDRFNRHRIVLLTQTLAMMLALILAALTLTGVVQVWQLVVISLLSGTVDAFDIPARQYLMTEMVGTANDLANAIALNSSIFNAARIVGPALAGALLAWTSSGVCFLANGASFLAVLVALLAMRLPSCQAERSPHRLLAGIGEGITYAWGFSPIRAVLLLTAVVSMAAMASSTLLPVVATSMLHGDSKTLGVLTAATGSGALIGTMLLAARSSVVGLGKWIAAAPAVFGLGLAAFSCATFFVGFEFVLGAGWVCIAFGHGRQQHGAANHRRRRQTGARDELVHHGCKWPGAHRRASGRVIGIQYRRCDHFTPSRGCIHSRLAGLHALLSTIARTRPSHLPTQRLDPRAGCSGGQPMIEVLQGFAR